MDERYYWLGFSFFHGIGPKKFRLLLEKFWNAENAWNATELELKHCGIGEKVTHDFLVFRKSFSPASYAEQLEKKGVSFIIQTDTAYPALLSQIDTPPIGLFVKGEAGLLSDRNPSTGSGSKFIAVVGTRKVTEYGKYITETLTEDLAAHGCVIVSGLAMGVDAIAHASALRAKGKTVAVLGCGVDCCTPRENQRLYDQIVAEGGLIVSEVPLGHMPFKGSFPQRNRIIAGMSEGVLVTEGAEDSGSLITANLALQYERNVFAVPGPITSSVSRGPISLLSKGAKLVVRTEDVLKELGVGNAELGTRKKDVMGDTQEEQVIIDLLRHEPLQFDEIVRKTALQSSQVGTTLSLMEMKGYITASASGVFSLE